MRLVQVQRRVEALTGELDQAREQAARAEDRARQAEAATPRAPRRPARRAGRPRPASRRPRSKGRDPLLAAGGPGGQWASGAENAAPAEPLRPT